MGGIQALEFAAQFPDRLDRLVGLACTHQTTPGTVAFRRVQRRAILADPEYKDGNYTPSVPLEGMKVARELGMTCYRSREEFDARFDWNPTGPCTLRRRRSRWRATWTTRPTSHGSDQPGPQCAQPGRGYEPHLVRHPGHRHPAGPADPDPGAAQPREHLAVVWPQRAAGGGGLQVRPRLHVQRQMQRDVFSPLVREYVEEQLANILPHEQHRYSSL
ncbi:Alpha/Beta hydrolase fold [Phytophthora cactorum]|nr:Alpha/Beta hydrolase fold [Phytophthora cactorum]